MYMARKDELSWSEELRRLKSGRVAKSGLALVTKRTSVGMKSRTEKDSLSFLVLAMARKTKEKGSVKRKSICVGSFSEIVPCLVGRYLSQDLLLLMEGHLITLRKCTYHLSQKRQPVVCLSRNGPKRQTSEASLTCSPLSSLQQQIPSPTPVGITFPPPRTPPSTFPLPAPAPDPIREWTGLRSGLSVLTTHSRTFGDS
jgi:hypothetical protein